MNTTDSPVVIDISNADDDVNDLNESNAPDGLNDEPKKKRGRKPKQPNVASLISGENTSGVDDVLDMTSPELNASKLTKTPDGPSSETMKKRGRKPKALKNEANESVNPTNSGPQDPDASSSSPTKTQREKRERKPRLVDSSFVWFPSENENSSESPELLEASSTSTPGPKKRGRKPKNSASQTPKTGKSVI